MNVSSGLVFSVYVFSAITLLIVLSGKVRFGILYFLPLIPLRFIFEEMQAFPLGKDMLDLMILALIIGWILSNNGFVQTKTNKTLTIYMCLMCLSFLNGYIYLESPPSLSDFRLQLWKDYMLLPIIFFIVLNNIKNQDDIKKLVFNISIIFVVVVLMFYLDFADTSHEHFRERNRMVSAFVYLGANHLAAFFVEYMAIFLTIYYFYKKNKITKMYYLIVSLISFYPILFLYSRGAYIAVVAVLLLLGIIKDRRVLVACFCILILWQVILPNSVVERVDMTTSKDSHNADEPVGRLVMWGLAFDTFKANPVFGIGFRAFEHLELEGAPMAYKAHGGQHYLKNVHNIYFQTMAEMGVIGIAMLLYLFFLAFRSGWKLYKTASDDFLIGLGLGFSLSVVALLITNFFGDRWYILLIQIYFWMFWALVERGLIITKAEGSLRGYATG